MSYDICIRSDETFTDKVLRSLVSDFLSAMDSVTQQSPTHLVLKDVENDVFIEFDLELVSEEGDYLDVGEVEKINCIRIHTPNANNQSEITYLYSLCLQIARHVGWKVFDEQEGQYVDH